MEAEDTKESRNNNEQNDNQTKKDPWENLSSKAAKHYYEHVTPFTLLHATDLIMAMYSFITKPNITILDIGCGPATFGLAYLKQFPQGIEGQTLIMTDLSEGMLKEAQRVMEQHVFRSSSSEEFQTRLKYQVEDGSSLNGIEDDSIDIVVSVFGIFVIPDHVATLKAIARVLRRQSPSSIFSTAVWTISEHHKDLEEEGYGPSFHMVIEESLKQLTDFGKASGEDTWKRWFSIDNIRRMIIDDVGDQYDSKSLKIRKSVHTVVWPSSQELWNMIETNPLSKITEHPDGVINASKENLFISLSKAHGKSSFTETDEDQTKTFLPSTDNIADACAAAKSREDDGPVTVITASNLVLVKLSQQ